MTTTEDGAATGAAKPLGVLWSWKPDEHPTIERRVLQLDPSKVLPAPPALTPPIFFDAQDEEIWTGLRAARRRRRNVRAGLVALLVAACATLPWAVPQLPQMFADAVPARAATTPDPMVVPPSSAPGNVLRPVPGLADRRLASAGTPLEVVVPRLHVRSPVVPISGQSGELVPPSDPQLLGWWQEGRGAGSARGSTVVTGHTVSTGGGAFDHLGELLPGDRIRVRTAAGAIDYVVRQSRDVPVGELARTAASIFAQSGPGRLVLITCSDFDGHVYRSNSVVYAAPVRDFPRKQESAQK